MLRLAAGLAVAALAAVWFQIDSSSWATMTAQAEPSPASRNTGSPAGGAFLMDFRKAIDPRLRYLAEYEMDEEWIKIAYRERNIRFDQSGMTLTLSKSQGKLPFSGSEFQRSGTYGYGRYEVVMTASKHEGAVSSFFTYTGPTFGDPHDEIDFEFLGRTPRHVYVTHFNNSESEQVEIPLWFDVTKADHLYAFEWAPDSIRWYVDGVKIHEVDAGAAKVKIPTTTGRVIVNLWAGAGPTADWTGEAKFTHTAASYRCISHVPIGEIGPQCSDTFKLMP
jgi:hypothetical protein